MLKAFFTIVANLALIRRSLGGTGERRGAALAEGTKSSKGETIAAEQVGVQKTSIPVEISTRFLEHFSEQLYSSPQKAFEELVSNGWDAGANVVDVRIPEDLAAPESTLAVLDNGASMDEAGLRDLWHIAFSPKRDLHVQHGRPLVGKFGIGKLATYVLAERLTYICKGRDGVIRRVTMDYADVDRQAQADKLISELKLDLYELTAKQLDDALKSVSDGDAIKKLIADGMKPDSAGADNEFGGYPSALTRDFGGTWTLVILSGLKRVGRELKVGVLRRMLEAALPLSTEMTIRVNGVSLASSKLATKVASEWVIGPELNISEIELTSTGDDDATSDETAEKVQVVSGTDPYPYVELPDVGRITGRVTLYEDKITGGKSEERGASNGFFVNVLGRVVNQGDPSFGAENLSHAAWARFRMTVRADGLNVYLNTNREQFRDHRALRVFRAFLRRAFNLTRTAFDSFSGAEMPDGGDVLVKSLGVLSLAPLRSAVSEALRTTSPIPGLFDETGVTDREQARAQWRENTADHIQNALSSVRYERGTDDSFVKFRLADNSIVINRDHPFVMEHSRTKAEKELMRTVAMVNLLSDVFALENGVEAATLQGVRDYRDQLMRFRALQRRQSGTHIAQLLLATQHKSSASNQLEKAVGAALGYLGFQVKEIGGSGEPEGIATAHGFSEPRVPTEENPEPPLYRFTYDAKSSKHDAAKTGNVSLDGINEHRLRYGADYALVVAPDFQEGALPVRAEQQDVTPMRARDLGKLLEYTVEYGAIPFDTLQKVFSLHDPTEVAQWIERLEGELKRSRRFTIDVFLKALEALRGKVPDVLQASLIAFTCRTTLGVPTVVDGDVVRLVKGLSILVPDLIGIDEKDRIVVNASAERVAAAVEAQLEKLHQEPELSEESN